MDFLGSNDFFSHSSTSSLDDLVINSLLISHNPDGRHFDSELLLRAMQNVMLHATTLELDDLYSDPIFNKTSEIEVFGSQESLGQTIQKISCKMQCKNSSERDLHRRTMFLFDMLGHYKWDEKLVLVLAAFATSYGEFWLLMQLYPSNPVAVSIVMLKRMPNDMTKLKSQFKALSLLVKSLVNITKCTIKFEDLPLSYVELENPVLNVTKSQIYVAAYWVIRSTLICSSQIANLIAIKPDEPHDKRADPLSSQYSNLTITATWELSSMVYRLSRMYKQLGPQVEACNEQIEKILYQKLLNIFKEPQVNNQEVLHVLFGLKDDLPLKKHSSQAKFGISEMINKVLVLLISRPELLLIEETLFLVQQTYDHPHKSMLEGNYEFLWVPIQLSNSWTEAEKISFNGLSDSLPWYSVRQPWLLNSAVVKFIREEWNYRDEPVMVVLDSKGMVTNSNALDMVFIWGLKAYPFSTSGEHELWEEEKWTLQLLIDEIDTLLAKWVHEDRYICIYGSENRRWIQELTSNMKEIQRAGLQIKIIYIGWPNPGQNVRDILATIDEENISTSLSFTKICFFWLRLESMRRSKLRQKKTNNTDQWDHIQKEVSALLDINENDNGWAVIGKGCSDMVKLQGPKDMEWLNMFGKWEKKEHMVSGGCGHSKIIPYDEGLIGDIVFCDQCECLMKEFVIYD